MLNYEVDDIDSGRKESNMELYFLFTLITLQFFNIVYQYRRLNELFGFVVRRWWVRPHIQDAVRELFGAYEALFRYYAENDQEEFVKMTRMTPWDFEELHNIVGPHLQKFSFRRPLPTRLRLALCLNFLAHGDSVATTRQFFRIGRSTTYAIIAEICPIIWRELSPLVLRRKTQRELKIIAGGFRAKWDRPNCVGIVDGKEIRIKSPPHSGSLFFNYKKFFSFKLLAACDAYYRFIWIDVGDYGSVSDTSAFKNTYFHYCLERNEADFPPECRLPRSNIIMPHFLIGDEIFQQQTYMMVPFARHRGLTERLSRARNCIEDAFGILCSMWQILHKKLSFKLDTSIAIVEALVCLHNFILNKKLERGENFEWDRSTFHRINPTVDPDIEEDVIPQNRFEFRERLADYFQSEAGAIYFN
ncbi:uncharacterized protein LOC122501147 [Leptopilina heterotoma]|uniref:uncharacterized protein LOC122501147 n=1 Tax=Leptopilina heterotoma TaxID=63436 RepID=UPI001CA85DCE|nr:uncharacterized protein LOC122501147 [Leptopilina heterotoma]